MACPMDFRRVSWNVRGVVSKEGRRHVKEPVRRLNPSVFILLETHVAFAKAEGFSKNIEQLVLQKA